MTWKHLIFNKKDNVAILSINSPETLNALSSTILNELNDAIDEIIRDEEIYVLIITGEGRSFVAGADISEMHGLDADSARSFSEKGNQLFRKIELMEKPVIAAVNGFALGGGCELAISCDIRIASEKAKFGQPEVGLGITPGFGGTQRLSRLVGISKAKELIFSCEVINGLEAEKIGLVNRIVPPEELMCATLALANKIVSNGQIAIRYAKSAINKGIDTDLDTGISIEKSLFGLCFATTDQKEGMSAFIEKRQPNFEKAFNSSF